MDVCLFRAAVAAVGGGGRAVDQTLSNGHRISGCSLARAWAGPPAAMLMHGDHTKNSIFLNFFIIFRHVFPNIWPLAEPNIAKKGGPLQKLARVDRQTHFGTFNFWLKPGFPI